MTLVTESVSSRSLDFPNQRKAYVLRHVHKQSWETIAGQVVNVSGGHPSWVCVRETVQSFSVAKGRRQMKYDRCGRKPWNMTKEVQQFLVRRLLARRTCEIVTSVSLQADLAKEMQVTVEDSTIRKFLRSRGYQWLPRSQKRRYDADEKKARVTFAKAALRLSKKDLRAKLNMSMDGVVLSMPPGKESDRFNYCWGGATHMWRRKTEANTPALAGADEYDKQVPLSRSIPLWGGVSQDGFAAVLWHLDSKKTNKEDWSQAVRDGKLTAALRALNPKKKRGPWTILCDHEGFLRAKISMEAYRTRSIALWSVPPKSPDLNPVEMFWGWLRKKRRPMDLEDLRKKRQPLGKTAYAARVKGGPEVGQGPDGGEERGW